MRPLTVAAQVLYPDGRAKDENNNDVTINFSELLQVVPCA